MRTPPIAPPRPQPPIALRPRRMSVTKVETWIANPYAVFAADILRLEKLPVLGQQPDAALRGAVVHAALGRFVERWPERLPDDAAAELTRIAAGLLAELKPHPRVAAFWLPRFARFAQWFAETEPARRRGITQVVAETSAEHILDAPAGPFTLTARADRIDIGAAGLAVTDYKTGTPPSARRVLAGDAPQLPLEAALAELGAFAHVPQQRVTGLRYIRASGGEPPGEERTIACDDVTALGQQALKSLAGLVARYDDPATPYSALRRPRFRYDYDDFAHLARVKEWAIDEGEESDGGGDTNSGVGGAEAA
jgi:ATP-dependent helicase/nuclease subunit B